LIGVLVIENLFQVISIDNEGIIKVWDVKKFNCIQNLTVDSADDKVKFHPVHFIAVNKPIKLIISGRTISIFDYDKNYNPHIVDDTMANYCKFIHHTLSIITTHGSKIKI